MLTAEMGVGMGTKSGDIPTLLGLVVEVKGRRGRVREAHWTKFWRSAATHKGGRGHAPPVAWWCKVHTGGRVVGSGDGGETGGRSRKGGIRPKTEREIIVVIQLCNTQVIG